MADCARCGVDDADRMHHEPSCEDAPDHLEEEADALRSMLDQACAEMRKMSEVLRANPVALKPSP